MAHEINTSQAALADVRESVRTFVGKTHPVALIAWCLVGVVLLGALTFTAWHNWSLYARGADTEIGKALSIVPALLLDGSIALLMLLLLTYFKDSLQWWLGAMFNALLFVIVGVNTSLDYSLNQGEPIGTGLNLYLKYGVLGSFLLCFALWEVLIHVDPNHRHKMRRARVEAEAREQLNLLELDFISLDVERRQNDLEYIRTSMRREHQARMNARTRDEVEAAWGEFEDAEAIHTADEVRKHAPKLNVNGSK